MRLLFDHGTLVFTEPPDSSFDFVPGLLWDERVALFRAPAFRYASVVEALSGHRVPICDEVLPHLQAKTAEFERFRKSWRRPVRRLAESEVSCRRARL
jgi:hypothetical protein